MAGASTEIVNAKTKQFILSPAFRLGFLQIRFYSLFMVAAIIIGYCLAGIKAKKENIERQFFENMVFWLIIISFLSARVYYLLFYWQFYKDDWTEVFKIWHGGLAIYGALIGGLLTLIYFAVRHKQDFFKLSDIVVFALPLSQAIGRFGNYFNYEAFGAPTDLPWKMFVPWAARPLAYKNFSYFHPTFLYEALWDIMVFLILFFAGRKKNIKAGILTGLYLFSYSLGRFFIESIRLDSAYFGPFRGDQITALLIILLALVIIITRYAPQNN